MPALRHHLNWLGPVLVLGIAALLRFWALGRPSTLVFDELFYVRDAISQLAHGYPTTWPDSDPDMSGGRATGFGDQAAYAVHPPLGKWLIGLGVLFFGPESSWGWRFTVAMFGLATVALTMRLGYLLTKNHLIASLAGLLLAIDGVHVTLSRVALLDGFLTFFVLLGAVFIWRDIEGSFNSSISLRWWRPWLLAAGLAFGAAAAVKWSGLYPLAFYLLFIAVCDLMRRFRAGSPHPVTRSALHALVAGITALIAASAAYLASWAGWIASPGGHSRDAGASWVESLIAYHSEMFGWHSTLNAEHPYMAHPLGWPLALKPTAMYSERWGDTVSGISALPNPLVTWVGFLALLVLVVLAIVRRRDSLVLTAGFVLTGYLSGWLPWVLTLSRSAVFHFYTVVLTPFTALALAIVLAMLCRLSIRTPLGISAPLQFTAPGNELKNDRALSGRRASIAVFVGVAVIVALLFLPVWSATPVADWFWRSHMWLPGWN